MLFTHYMKLDFPATKQVRHYLANDVALKAVRSGAPLPDGAVLFVEVFQAKLDGAGNPVKGPDGFFEKDKLLFFTAMERQAGWGDAIPPELRNADWRYALFAPDGSSEQVSARRAAWPATSPRMRRATCSPTRSWRKRRGRAGDVARQSAPGAVLEVNGKSMKGEDR